MFEHNVNAHLAKAEYWESQGRPDYAAGSRRKAARWQQKARELDVSLNGPYPTTGMQEMMASVIDFQAKMLLRRFLDSVL